MIALDPSAANESIRYLNAAITGIEDELTRLDREVAMLHSRWSGDAQASYERAQTQWRASLGALRAISVSLTTQASAAVSTLNSTESAVRGLWS